MQAVQVRVEGYVVTAPHRYMVQMACTFGQDIPMQQQRAETNLFNGVAIAPENRRKQLV